MRRTGSGPAAGALIWAAVPSSTLLGGDAACPVGGGHPPGPRPHLGGAR
ncbi:hypothetical protein ACSNOI_07005 [Actinomadura kijaniata]